jgi:hypothetical protein
MNIVSSASESRVLPPPRANTHNPRFVYWTLDSTNTSSLKVFNVPHPSSISFSFSKSRCWCQSSPFSRRTSLFSPLGGSSKSSLNHVCINVLVIGTSGIRVRDEAETVQEGRGACPSVREVTLEYCRAPPSSSIIVQPTRPFFFLFFLFALNSICRKSY